MYWANRVAGVSDRSLDAAADLPQGVLGTGEMVLFHGRPVFRDIDQILGVLATHLEELKLLFDLPEVVFGNVLLSPFAGRDVVFSPNPTDGYWRN